MAVVLVLVGYPLVNESTKRPCGALEKRFVTLATRDGDPGNVLGAAIAKELLGVGRGFLAEEYARQRHPDFPAFATCYADYWHSMYDRQWLLKSGSRIFKSQIN